MRLTQIQVDIMYISEIPNLPIFVSYVAFICLAGILILKKIVSRNTRYRDNKKEGQQD